MKLTCLQCETAYEIAEGSDLKKTVCPSCKAAPSDFFVYSRTLEFDHVDPIKPLSEPSAPTIGYPQGKPPNLERIGRYEIKGRAGAGGMGVVYRALDTELNRTVALKVMIAGEHATEATINRFQREARSAAKLSHPNIVRVYDVGQIASERPGGAPIYYFAMELVDGRPVDKVIRDPGLPARETARITRDVARALQYAHEQGIVHRDIKPGNLLLDAKGVPHLLDFGLAKEVHDSQTLTKTGEIIGTASYMPPEQARGDMKEVDALSDIYSLGTVLYEMLTKRPPFHGETMARVLRDVEERDPDPPTSLDPSIPRELETICLKAMAKVKARRYPTAGAFADDLDRFLKGEAIVARPSSVSERATKWARRHPALTTAMTMLIIFTTLGVALRTRSSSRPLLPPPPPGPDWAAMQAKAEPRYFTAKAEFEKAKRYKRPDQRPLRISVFTHAHDEVNAALAIYPKYAEAFALRGAIRVELNQPDKALEDFDAALRIKSTQAEVYYLRVSLRFTQLAHRLGRALPFELDEKREDTLAKERPLIEADIERLRALKIRPDEAFVAEARYALFFHEAGESPAKLVEDALRENPTFADAYALRAFLKLQEALAMRRNGDRTRSAQILKDALTDAARAIDEDANHRDAYRVRSDIHMALGERERAVRDLDEIVAIAPEEAQSYLDRAIGLMRDLSSPRSRARVFEDLNRAITLDPDNVRARFMRGGMTLLSDRTVGDRAAIAKCREDFEFILARDPALVEAHAFRLVCDMALGDPAFEEHFQQFRKVRPDKQERIDAIIQGLSRKLMQPRKLGESEGLLERAQVFAEQDNLAEAEEAAQQLLRRLDDPVTMSLEALPPPRQAGLRAESHYLLACVYSQRNELDRSIASIESALKSGYPRVDELEFDSELEAVRVRPEFRVLLNRYRRE